MKKRFETLIELISSLRTEKQCIQFFIKLRWNGKITCPFKECSANEFEVENNKIYHFADGKRFKCSTCKKIFSYKTGSIFENTKVSMKKWLTAIYLQTANKKGISSCQLARQIGVHQGTAWFMLQRIRFLQGNDSDSFSGTTEIDEVYLGGKEQNRHMKDRIKGTKEKTAVLGMVNHETGKVKAFKLENTKYHTIGQKVIDNVKMGSEIITDESTSYITLNKFYNHETINHSKGEYSRKDNRKAYKITTNKVEGMFAHIRKTIECTYHWISKRHLQRYMNEFVFRWNSKKESDRERFLSLFSNVEKRLTYKALIG